MEKTLILTGWTEYAVALLSQTGHSIIIGNI